MFHASTLDGLIHGFQERHVTVERSQHPKIQFEEPQEHIRDDGAVLFILALGEAYTQKSRESERVTDIGGHSAINKSTYYAKAAQTIESHNAGTDLYHAQKLLLAAHYNGLIGCSDKSAEFFASASTVLRFLLHNKSLLFPKGLTELLTEHGVDVNSDIDLALGMFKERILASQEKMSDSPHVRIVMTAWTCLRLLRRFFPTDHEQVADLCEIEDLLPTFLLIPEKSVCRIELPYSTEDSRTDDNEAIHYFNQALTSIERLRERCTRLCRNDAWSLSRQALRNSLEWCKEDVNRWKTFLPNSLKWDEQPTLPSNSLLAQLEKIYRETMWEMNSFLHEEPLL